MFTVLNCIRQQHDLRFVALAAVICVVAAVSAFGFFRRARGSLATRAAWVSLTGLVGGSGIWATHFIAMLAYEPKLNIHFAVGWTVISWIVAVVGVGGGFAIASLRPGMLPRSLGGLLVGLSIGAMHFLGMTAVRLSGWVLWRPDLVIASLVIGAVGAAAALASVSERPGWRRQIAPPLLFVLAIVGLHFTAMAAAIILPSNAMPIGDSLIGRGPLALIVGALTGFIFLSAGSLVWMQRFAQGSTLNGLRASLNALPSGIAFFDRNRRLLAWNEAFEVMIGEEPPLTRGEALEDILQWADAAGVLPEGATDAEALRTEVEAMNRGEVLRESVLADGRWMRLETRNTPDGGAVVVLTDTTQANTHARSLAAARDAAEAANRAKTEFLANMSHEIRTPLNGVLGIAEALARTRLTARQAEMLAIVRESGETLDALLGDILDLARVEAGEIVLAPQPLRLPELCHAVSALFADRAEQKGLQFRVEIGAGAGAVVMADPLRVRQVLTNLVSNAVKFTETGAITVAASRSGDLFRLEVRDTGPGFDRQLKEQLFQRFGQGDGSITRAHGGAGLGLPLCKRLALLMNATIEADSRPGEGATFALQARFPVIDGTPAVPDAPEAAGRVLVVDDNPTNRQVLELILESAGLEHDAAENGLQAVEAIQAGDFDAVLMDIQMPVMDGLEATRRIRAWERAAGRPRTPIHIVSANCLPEHVVAGEVAGADSHVGKPVSAAKVLGALASDPLAASEAETPARAKTGRSGR